MAAGMARKSAIGASKGGARPRRTAGSYGSTTTPRRDASTTSMSYARSI
jgi:hypothetical protein